MDFGVTKQKQTQLQLRMTACGLNESDFSESFIRSTGPGGQNVNKTATCVYLKHLPTGLEVKMQKNRTQSLNRFHARCRMCELLEEKILGRKSPQALTQQKIRKQKDRRKRRKKTT